MFAIYVHFISADIRLSVETFYRFAATQAERATQRQYACENVSAAYNMRHSSFSTIINVTGSDAAAQLHREPVA